jgi:hypothetical protein
MANVFTDPRGPLHTIVSVGAYRLTTAQNASGGCIPVTLDCGHTAEMNFTFSYRVGEQVRCHACARQVKA